MERMDRRGFLECMTWVGTGVVWTAAGGVLSSRTLAHAADSPPGGDFSFVQISDTHIGFKGEANKDATATLGEAIAKINARPSPPAFVLHTGDLTHGQKAGTFDAVAELLKTVKTERVFYVPGENDVFLDGGKEYLGRYGQGTAGGRGWQSFDYRGVHFVGLVNVQNYKASGLGSLGGEQLEWLEKDVQGLSSSAPIVVFTHVPLWAVYPKWGWATADGEQALGYLKRFGSVTVLNGHIHQVMQKIEGNVSFHTAMSTAFPQPAPGAAPAPGPMKVPDDRLRGVLGLCEVSYVEGRSPLAVVDRPLAS
jgi:Icc protein